jgi:ribosome-binding protein aMBF1 (putative translation factor)
VILDSRLNQAGCTASESHSRFWGMRRRSRKLKFVNKGDAAYQRAYQAFLKRLIKARQDAGYLQGEVAERLGKSHSFVSKCELGERRLDIIELQRIAKIYRKTIGYFLGED